jgi:Mrp family chromosome partitioning ATPase
LRALEREATAQRQLLESYLTRYREASSRTDRGYLPADARIFSRADRPIEPYFPKKIPMTIAAFVASLLLLSIITLLRALFSGQALRPAYTQPVVAEDIAPPMAVHDIPEPAQPVVEPAQPMAEPVAPLAADIREMPEEQAFSEAKEQLTEMDTPAAEAPVETPVETSAIPTGHSGIANVATRLMASGAARAVVVSPEGDEASALTILLVRELADRGVRVILVDMTGSGEIGRSMLDDKNLPGITNLLVSEKHFSDVIHPDHYSQAEIIPLGNHDPAKAMQSVGRLPMILNALQSAYDLVVVDAGPATVVELKHLLADGTELILGVVDPDDPDVAATAKAVYDAKLLEPELLTPFEKEHLRLDSGRIVRSA